MAVRCNELGIDYYHIEPDTTVEFDPGYNLYQYTWRHIPSGKSGIRTIAVLGGQIGLLKLLARWSGGDWMYLPLV